MSFFSHKFSSRKWHIALFVLALASILAFIGKISGIEWEITVLVTYICYLIGNIYSASLLGFSIQSYSKEKKD